MNNQFKFENFEPGNELKLTSAVVLEEIMDCAPSDATPLARLVSRRGGYEATVEIFSSSGYFVGRAFETTPESALETVKNRIEAKLSKWKSDRFLEECTGGFSHDINNQQPGENHGTHFH